MSRPPDHAVMERWLAVPWLAMHRTGPREIYSKHLGKVAVALLLVAALAFLAGCQGISAGASVQVQTGTLSMTNGTLNFGSVAAGSSETLSATVTNSGPGTVTISSVTFSTKYFSLNSPSLPLSLAEGQSTQVSVTFAPNAAGTFSATATITSNASNTATVNLLGTGTGTETAGELTPSPTSLGFGSVTVGSDPSLSETVTNTGGSSVTISQVAISGSGFTLSGITAPVTLTAGQSTSFSVAFAPTSTGSASGNVTITSNASNSTLTIPLSGTGTAAAAGQLAVSPTTLGVGNVVVGTSGTASGTLTASGASVTVTAASTNDESVFSVSGLSLPVTIPAGESVPFTVTFSPATTGAASATLTFTSNAAPSTTTEALTGTGTAAPTHTVSLSWDASTSPDISGYNIYRSPYSGSCGTYAKINSALITTTVYTDSAVTDGDAYCYAATAVNSSEEESGYSNIVSNVQIPAQ